MKKLNKILLLMLAICLFSINDVQAGGKKDDEPVPDKLATCKYTTKAGGFDVSFEISLNADGSISRTPDSGDTLGDSNKYAYYPKGFNEEFKSVIYRGEKIAKDCPTVYVCDGDLQFSVYSTGVTCTAGNSSKGVTGSLTYVSSSVEQSTNEKKVYCTKRKTLRNSSAFDAKIEFFKDVDGKNKFSVYKVFKHDNSEVLMGTADPTGIIMLESFYVRLGDNYDAYFSDKCSSLRMYFKSTSGNDLYVQQEKPDDVENGSYAVTETGKDSGKDLDEDKNKSSGGTKKNTDLNPYTGCPLGEDVTKDLYGALKIFKIAAPLLVIGFTIFEFVQALAKGDITAELKKLSQRLLKRCIFAVVLFFLPVLVNQVMQLANVWNENGTCDFSNSLEVKPDDPRTEDERRITSCAGHSDLTSCNNDTTNKCKWSYSGNFCEAEKIKSDDENRITSCGGHSDLTSCNGDTTNNCKWNYTGNYCERVKCGDFGDNTTCTKNGCSWSYSGNFCEYKK